MLRCVVLDDEQRVAREWADWGTLGARVRVDAFDRHIGEPDALACALADAQIVVAMRERTPFPAALLRRLPQLRLLVTTGMRNAAIDIETAVSLGIVVCGTESAAEPAAELTWALLLALARHVGSEDLSRRRGAPWQQTVGADLAGRTLGLLGLGRIGQRVARVGRAFDMRVVAASPHLTAERAAAAGADYAATVEALMDRSDFVSVHLALGDGTRSLVDRAALAAMRRTAFFVNTSRAAIVDQEALVDALRRGAIAGAGLDVFDEEPLADDHPLRSLSNVVLTPHLGYVTEGNYRTYYRQAVEDIEAFLAGAPVRCLAAPQTGR